MKYINVSSVVYIMACVLVIKFLNTAESVFYDSSELVQILMDKLRSDFDAIPTIQAIVLLTLRPYRRNYSTDRYIHAFAK